jgi:hypothetical protein
MKLYSNLYKKNIIKINYFTPVNFIIKYLTDSRHFELKNETVLYFALIFNYSEIKFIFGRLRTIF